MVTFISDNVFLIKMTFIKKGFSVAMTLFMLSNFMPCYSCAKNTAAKRSEKESSQTLDSVVNQKLYEESLAINRIETAAEYLDNNNNRLCMFYLERMLDEQVSGIMLYDLDEIELKAQDVLNKYRDNKKFFSPFVRFGRILHKKQKIEFAKHILDQEVEYLDKNFGNPDSFNYFLVLAYNYTINKTGSIKETHSRLRKFCAENTFNDYSNILEGNIWESTDWGSTSIEYDKSITVEIILSLIEATMQKVSSPFLESISEAYLNQ